MKTVLITLVSGICVALLTSTGIKKDIELFNHDYETNEFYGEDENFELIENYIELDDITLEDVFGNPEESTIVKIEDVVVYEIEEGVNLGFDTKDYLPTGFNPYSGEESKEELEVDSEIAFRAVFGDTKKENNIGIEDIIIHEIKEEINLGFNTKDYLPTDFNPYKGMDTKEELEMDSEIAFRAVFGNIEKEKIVKVEDIIVYEIEETI
ncbi:hypothetical protein [Seonamhaeicola maritimus]|uniref:Uncharacterized protein n=1 Tax=Seonamhaeicola maritimus TaxID=2591822 RepID=A0A5C7GL68_9FLAO|nr:hypothetical protein [Seonamhaeicola maritimus]TXG39239.1 hypothetical protein FUA22_05010 [Seonamhaeicola maritimus]